VFFLRGGCLDDSGRRLHLRDRVLGPCKILGSFGVFLSSFFIEASRRLASFLRHCQLFFIANTIGKLQGMALFISEEGIIVDEIGYRVPGSS